MIAVRLMWHGLVDPNRTYIEGTFKYWKSNCIHCNTVISQGNVLYPVLEDITHIEEMLKNNEL